MILGVLGIRCGDFFVVVGDFKIAVEFKLHLHGTLDFLITSLYTSACVTLI
jgi:hypothetical protein